MYRGLHLGNASDGNAFANRRIVALDQSNRAVMRKKGVEALEWGRMVTGHTEQLSEPPVVSSLGFAFI